MTWLGRKKLAFVPVYRPNAHPPDQIPADWSNQILRRVLFDPDPMTGADRSLRAYIHAASSGRADLHAIVLPMEIVDQQDVPPNILEGQLGSQLRDQGFNAAAIVMLGGPGAGTSAGFWVRFVMLEGVGVWAMEFMHSLTGFADLYPFNGNMGDFDEMACACGTHPSAYTKAAIDWLGASAIAQHSGRVAGYDLHSVGLVQPPPSGRSAAIRIGSQVPYLMVEARQRVDQFDGKIPSEGVIVYRVQTSDPLGHAQNNTAPIARLTRTALTVGQAFTADANVSVSVTGTIPGGFNVVINDPNAPFETGQLLSYGDNGSPGNVSDPVVVGFGGWSDFKFLFAGGDRIYAVDQNGQLLSYGDSGSPGNVSDPVVVGFGGWSDFKFLFAGGNRIYAVDQNGQLLSYGDSGTPGNVSDPVVVGFGGWSDFKFLFAGGNRIYAVDQNGQLLSYGDSGTPGNVSDPVVVGFGGWSDFKFLFAGGSRIYAVDQNGQLLSYGDNGTPGNVSDPVVVGFGGWSDFKFLFAGGNRIYAVVA